MPRLTATRRGMGRGKGSGWMNMRPDDPMRHGMSAKGIKTAQRVAGWRRITRNTPLLIRNIGGGDYALSGGGVKPEKLNIEDKNVEKKLQEKVKKFLKEKEAMNKVDIDYIEVTRAEGSHEDDPNLGKTQRFKSFEDAEKRLREISQTAPKGGAYDKTDVKVVWKNGDSYEGRWDVKHFSESNNDISVGQHIRETLEYNIGEGRKFLEEAGMKKEVKESAKMLKKLNLGDDQKDDRVNDVQIKEDKSPLDEKELRYFTGSEKAYQWSAIFPNIKATEGAKYVADKGGAYWLLDAVASWQTNPKVRKEEFQVWELKKIDGNEAILTAEDGNGKRIARQKIPYTDFPLNQIKLFYRDNIIMLPTEY